MITLTLSAFVAAMRAVVDAANADTPDGEFRYRSADDDDGVCHYATAFDGSPGRGCIVGETLLSLGVSREVLRSLDRSQPGARLALRHLTEWRVIDFASDSDGSKIITLSVQAQIEQDWGGTWSKALTRGLAQVGAS